MLDESSLSISDHAASSLSKVISEDGTTFFVPKNDALSSVWMRLLESSSSSRVYVQYREGTSIAQNIVPTSRRRIESLRKVNDDMQVRFSASPAAYYVRRNSPAHLLQYLERSLHDNRPVRIALDGLSKDVLDAESTEEPLTEAEPILELGPTFANTLDPPGITFTAGNSMFAYLASQVDIPFDYPDDCCYSRAHRMCHLLLGKGIQAAKVFNYGHGFDQDKMTLRVDTPNNPKGFVLWFYHVAPFVSITTNRGAPARYVIDPSLCKLPVPIAEWLRLQQDLTCSQRYAEDRIYYEPHDATVSPKFDDDFSDTAKTLAEHRYWRDVRRAGGH
jgi:hypothetical protein